MAVFCNHSFVYLLIFLNLTNAYKLCMCLIFLSITFKWSSYIKSNPFVIGLQTVNICHLFRNGKDGGKEMRYEVYCLWARCLHHWKKPFRKHGKFDFNDNLTKYLRDLTKGEIVDNPPPPDAITISTQIFVIRYLDDNYWLICTKKTINYCLSP